MKCAIMFADIVGSTRLYEELGDVIAADCVNQCIQIMTEITQSFNGEVINTIGDEIMSRFKHADDAVFAACRIHELFTDESISEHNVSLSLRIGIHFGETISRQDDVFGDAVNVASRVANIANARQIITTEELTQQLSPALAEKVREFDQIEIKGKQQKLIIYEVLWENRDITLIGHAISDENVNQNLNLIYHGQSKSLTQNSPSFILGRNPGNDLVVEAELVSRAHAYCVYRRGKFILIDQSTNGTFVKTGEGQEVYLRREEIPLLGSGLIGLGESTRTDNGQLIQYICV